MSEDKVLTKAIARQFLADEHSVDLEEYTEIEDDAAKVLAKHHGDLYLNGLTALSELGTKALAKHWGFLSLRGLRSLSETAVANLSQREGDLDLSGLTTLTDASAANLGKFKGEVLCLGGLTNLSHEQALALAKFQGELYLNGLTSLSDKEAAALAMHQGDLNLNGLTTLSGDSAKALAKHDGTLWLEGLTTISDTALEALAQCNGELKVAEPLAKALKQITCKITKVVAETFLTNEDSIDLSEFSEIDESAAKILAKHQGELDLSRLKTLSDTAAEHLSEHQGKLRLDVFSLNGRQGWSEAMKKLFQAKVPYAAFGDCSGMQVDVACGNCGKRDWIRVDLDLGEWRGDVRPSLENEGWKKISSDNWPSDDVIRCPDCVIKNPCTNCGETELVSLPGQEAPVCMACETDQLKEILELQQAIMRLENARRSLRRIFS